MRKNQKNSNQIKLIKRISRGGPNDTRVQKATQEQSPQGHPVQLSTSKFFPIQKQRTDWHTSEELN
jgi:hypothetical protein